ncbi:MAG: fatty acid desaturase [Paracoccaceae bacterium]
MGHGVGGLRLSFTNNTVFSLQHEAVHGHFHPNVRVNDAAGVLFAGFFPTIFAVQRISHLGHHRRNRTDEELYDYVLPGQSWWLKTYWIYCLLFGFYWMIIPVAMLLYMVAPWAFRSKAFLHGPARWWGSSPSSPISPRPCAWSGRRAGDARGATRAHPVARSERLGLARRLLGLSGSTGRRCNIPTTPAAPAT